MIVDRFSKAIIPVACNVELSAKGWARILRDHVYAKHGMPQVVISDRGPQFVSKFMKELYRLLNITPNALTAWHPQTDGQTERVNQEIEKYLRIFVNYRQDDWTIGYRSPNSRITIGSTALQAKALSWSYTDETASHS